MKDHIIIHCSATPYDREVTAADIDRWHRSQGWLGNGYHYVIRRDGLIESKANGDRCRPVDKPGAHVGGCGAGWNKRAIGICLAGGMDLEMENPSDNYTHEQWYSLYWLIGGLRAEFNIDNECIMGHRDLIELTDSSPKACPSFDVKKWMERIGLTPAPI